MSVRRLAIGLGLLSPIAVTAAAQKFVPQSALVAMVEVHKGMLIRYVDAAPDSMLTFRPTPGVRTFAEQIEHAAIADAYIAHLSIAGSDKIPEFGDKEKSYLKTKEGLKKYSLAAMDHAIAMVKGVSDAAMVEEITLFGKKLPRYRGLMELLDHFPWTLGQTVPYLRLNGVTPPSYSPF